MPVEVLVYKGNYYDSVTLMLLAKELSALSGVKQAVAVMATDMNRELLAGAGLLVGDALAAGPGDLVLAVEAESADAARVALEAGRELLSRRRALSRGDRRGLAPRTLEKAVQLYPDANLALISVPGPFVRREALEALRRGLHVMIFSDNVPLETELELKLLGREKGLLVMGPDCGTAIINGVGLGFANRVRRGGVGIVSASGSGLQEVCVQVHRLGEGVSHAVGTGGRDLSGAVGGISMMQGIRLLDSDPDTRVMVLVSKPPGQEVARAVLREAARSAKPKVICFLGGAPELPGGDASFRAAGTLEGAARAAVELATGTQVPETEGDPVREGSSHDEARRLVPGQRFLRGIFSGGTLCEEAILIARGRLGPVYSNVAVEDRDGLALKLEDPRASLEHTLVDMGDDLFTRGRAHPMLDPGLRNRRLIEEARDPGVGVLLVDVVMGYGAHPDPAAALVEAVTEARALAAREGRYIPVVAYLCGTDLDPQGLDLQELTLRRVGIKVLSSNARAARFACDVLQKSGKGGS